MRPHQELVLRWKQSTNHPDLYFAVHSGVLFEVIRDSKTNMWSWASVPTDLAGVLPDHYFDFASSFEAMDAADDNASQIESE